VAGVCTSEPLDCTSTDPCFVGSCDVAAGCVATPLEDFESVRCRLSDLGATIQADGIDFVGRAVLGKLLDKSVVKIDAAESGREIGNPGRIRRSLNAGRKKLVRLSRKVVKLQPKHIPDAAVGDELLQKTSDAISRVDALRSDLGL
jgi:hypothetical protein